MNKVNVYWDIITSTKRISTLLRIPPKLVILDIKDKISNEWGMESYLRCPAVTNEFKNTYVIKSPIDFEINIDPITLEPIFNNELSPYMFVRSKKGKIYDVDISQFLFSEKPLNVSIIPASLHFNNFTLNTAILPGRFDINKWFRPIIPSFKLRTPKISVKRGDALYYLKFHTEQKINLINYEHNDNILKIAESCGDVKFLKKGFQLKALYDMFISNGFQKKLLKEIKKNITPLK